MSIPDKLYHGSMYNTGSQPLVPGILHAGERISWDHGLESNEYLYATVIKKDAIILAFASLMEKRYGTERFHSNSEVLEVSGMRKNFHMDQLRNELVYVYTIIPNRDDGWEKNDNPYNQLQDEWKTRKSIPREQYSRETVHIHDWLNQNNYKVKVVGGRQTPVTESVKDLPKYHGW